MALIKCPDDVLFNIASYLHANSPPVVYCIDQQSRCHTFGRLVLVCCRFYHVFTRLLYRTLCISVENNSWPDRYKDQWLVQGDPTRRVMNALFRTLRTSPHHAYYTYYLELCWLEHRSKSHLSLNQLLRTFPNLIELDLDLGSVYLPFTDENGGELDFSPKLSFQHLKSLRITQLKYPDTLPHLFLLPNLQILHIETSKEMDLDGWAFGDGVKPGHSKVLDLSITGKLNATHLTQFLGWLAVLHNLTYDEDREGCEEGPNSGTFQTALRPFRATLKSLKISIPGSRLAHGHTFQGEETKPSHTDHDHALDLRSFTRLEELQAPSLFFTGPRGKNYSRERIVDLLPSSIRVFDCIFPPNDPVLPHTWRFYGHTWHGHQNNPPTEAVVEKYKWLLFLGIECTPWGRYPALQTLTVRDEGSTISCHTPAPLCSLYPCDTFRCCGRWSSIENWQSRVRLRVECTHRITDIDEYSEEYYEHDLENYEYLMCQGDSGPLFADEETVYSDSMHEYESEDEYAREYELEEDEVWERFDEQMAQQQEGWQRGQWPDYEDTREEREDLKRYSQILMLVSTS